MKKIIIFTLLTISFGVTLFFAFQSYFYNPFPDTQEIKTTSEPDNLAYWFLHALIADNIDLAKELVIPEKREQINQWRINSQHKGFKCSYNWGRLLNEPMQLISWGSEGSVEIDSETIKASYAFGCNNNNHSMSIDDVIIQKIVVNGQ